MSPDRNEEKTPAKFDKLLKDIDRADAKILRLFPSVDLERRTYTPQVKQGIETALRILLVAAEDGYVNEYELNEYGVGGYSRHRILHRLYDLGLLARSQLQSEKGGKKFEYCLSGKGLLLCAAFPRVFRSEQYVALIKECVTNKSLANTMLFLYHKPAGKSSNQLLEALRLASDLGSHLENLADEKIAERLLQAEENATADHAEILVFKHLPEVVDMLARGSDRDIEALSSLIAGIIKSAHAEPAQTKIALNLIGELRKLLRSPDFQILMRTPDGLTRFIAIGQESFRSQVGDLATCDDPVGVLLEKGKLIFGEFRKRLRQESLSRIVELEQKALEGAT
jgi:hypothetical protein